MPLDELLPVPVVPVVEPLVWEPEPLVWEPEPLACEPEPPVPVLSRIEPLVSRLEPVVRDGEPEGAPVPCASDGALPPVPREVEDVPLPRSEED